MATSLFLMASTEPTVPESSTHRCGCTEESKPDNPRTSRVRKTPKSAATAQKKQPQRGMGVAQLERLRFEEWKKMTEINRPQPMSFFGHFRYQIPVQFAEPPPAPPSSPVQPGLGPPGWVPRFGGGAFHGFGGGGGGFRVMDPYRNGGAVGTSPEALRELSSMPKMDCVFDRCDVCFKKKRTNGDSLGFSGGREKYAEIMTPPINGFDFLGLDMGNDENRDFSRRPPMSAGYACHNHSEDAEVVAVHRKGNSVNGSVFMEYEFFPGKGEASTSVGGGEGFLAIPTAAAATTSSRNASNLVDLSLKLSY